jgi:anthranilate phosphoribosyltransferase
LAVDGAASSLVMVKSVLDNKAGAARDIVALNAGAAIYAANITDSLYMGIEKAEQLIASGAARAKFDALIAYSKTS